jgi:aminopeptidase YwaD
MFMKKIVLLIAFVPTLLFSQSRKERKALEAQQKLDQVVISNLKTHIQNLTAGKASTSYEAQAVEYIANQFKTLGLLPKGSNGFIQPYKIDNGKRIDPSTYLKVNDKLLEVNKDYFPLAYSAEKKVKGTPAMALRERGAPWFVDVKDLFEDASKMQGGNVEVVIKKELARVASKGATALFLYNSSAVSDSLSFNGREKSAPSPIPVFYITAEGHKKYFSDHSQVLDVDGNIAFKEDVISGSNVIGYLNNGAASTIVISAHYSPKKELGGKSDESVRSVSPGANDNGSGVATLIELARMLSASKAKGNNYTFVAFGGNDGGSTASSYWLENTSINTPINYVLNLDMVGSYSDSKKLLVQGYNTSPVWSEVLTSVSDKKLQVSIDSLSNVTALNASFYKKEIPELTFSAADHQDYLTAADEDGKINYAGTVQIARFISRLVQAIDSKGKVGFSKVSNQHTTAVKVAESTTVAKPVRPDEAAAASLSRTTVSLGVIPDKANNDSGLKISGVTPKKLASLLVLQSGDVLTNLGSYKISDLKTYMQALSNFKAGDKTTLRIKRGKDDKEFAVEF